MDELVANLLAADAEGADVAFAPSVEELYPDGFDTTVDPGELGVGLRLGVGRHGHRQPLPQLDPERFDISSLIEAPDFTSLEVIRAGARDVC